MGPLDAIKTCFAKSFQFKGRATRSEFWWFALIFIAGCFINFWAVELLLPLRIGPLQNPAFFAMCAFLAVTIVPFASVGIRRFHDLQLNGFLFLIPILILMIGIGISLYGSLVANSLQQYAGLHGAIIGYGGFLITAPFVLLACTLKSTYARLDADPNPNEVPQ